MIKNKLFNKIISITLAVLTIVMGALFILQSIRLNNNYTPERITRVFFQIIAIIIVWVFVFVLSLFTKTEEKHGSKSKLFRKQVSERTYLIINIAYLAIVLASAFFSIAYLVQEKHFSFEFNKDVLAFLYYLMPFAVVLLASTLIKTIFVVAPKRKEMKKPDKKQLIITNSVRAGILAIAITFIVIGIVTEQAHDVFEKATKICLECIGIG